MSVSDACGVIASKLNASSMGVFYNSSIIRDAITTLGIPYVHTDAHITVVGTNMVDMLAIMLQNEVIGPEILSNCFQKHGQQQPQPIVKMIKMDPDAIIPSKARGSDVGFDLTVIKVHKVISDWVVMFDSGIQARIPWGTYLEIVPRSSLSKTGWMMANSVGIIDPSYTGNLLVACIKVDPDAPPLALPFRGFQIIVRKQHTMTVEEVEEEDANSDISKTVRGSGGFGSTDK